MKPVEAVFVLQKKRNKPANGQPDSKSCPVDEGNARVFYNAFKGGLETQWVHTTGVWCVE